MSLSELVSMLVPQKDVPQQTAMSSMANSSVGVGKDYVKSAVRSRFKSPALQAVLLASIDHETGGSFDPLQKQYGGGPGRGLIQMEGKMLKGYQDYLSKTKSKDSVDSQLNFIGDIMTSGKNYDIGAGNRNKLADAINTNDPMVVLDSFTNLVERPGKPMMESRRKALKKWIGNEVVVSPEKNMEMSDFEKAFASARKAGLKEFNYNGKKIKVEVK